MKTICTLTVFIAMCGLLAASFVIQVPDLMDLLNGKHGSSPLFVVIDEAFLVLLLPSLTAWGLWALSSSICNRLRKKFRRTA